MGERQLNSIDAKRVLARVWGLKGSERPRRVILLYHSIGAGPSATPVDQFRQQMQWLSVNAEVLTLDGLLSGSGKKLLTVSVTFDDGYASVASTAEPILHDLGFSAAVYINTGWMGEGRHLSSVPQMGHYADEEFMSWENIEFLAARNWTIGSHGVDHVDLTAVDDTRLNLELTESKGTIETRLGRECRHFAYTWGRNTRRVRRAVANTGYLTAAAAIHGPVTDSSDMRALPRIDVSSQYSLTDFQAIMRGDWDYLGRIQRLRRLSQRFARH